MFNLLNKKSKDKNDPVIQSAGYFLSKESENSSNFDDYRIFFHNNSHKIFLYLFVFVFGLQILFWLKTEKFHLTDEIVPAVPNKYLVSSMSLGDNEFLFRVLSLRFQNSGDVFSGFVSLRKYDFSRIYGWMKMLDTLNEKSSVIPHLASYYYSNVQNKKKLIYLINYLDEHGSKNIEEKARFMANAVMMAKFGIHDMKRAIEIAKKISTAKSNKVRLIYKQMYAMLNEEVGELCVAYSEMKRFSKQIENGEVEANEMERSIVKYFLEVRIYKISNGRFNPKKCPSR